MSLQHADQWPLWARAIDACVAFVALAVISGCLSLRAQHLTIQSLTRLPLIRLYLFALYVWCIILILSAAILRFGVGLTSNRLCHAAIYLCVALYVVAKALVYLFLIERIRVVRCQWWPRWKDRWHIFNLLFVILGFVPIGVLWFVWPISSFSTAPDNCLIGHPFKITLPILIYDITINIYMTAHFVYFARPRVVPWAVRGLLSRRESLRADREAGRMSGDSTQEGTLMRLARRTLKGMIVMLVATILNLLFHLRGDGYQIEWVCFILCTTDPTINIVTLHWITSDSSEQDLGRSLKNNRSHNDSCRHSQCQLRRPSPSSVNQDIGMKPPTFPDSCDLEAWREGSRDERAPVTVPSKILIYGNGHQGESSDSPPRFD